MVVVYLLDASCGDGFVQAGVEVCDDGNDDDTDGCLSTASKQHVAMGLYRQASKSVMMAMMMTPMGVCRLASKQHVAMGLYRQVLRHVMMAMMIPMPVCRPASKQVVVMVMFTRRRAMRLERCERQFGVRLW